jgi:hypothetical protein
MNDRFGAVASRAKALAARLFEALKPLLPAVGAYALVRLLCLIPPYLWALRADESFLKQLTGFDAHWYLQIARSGYGKDTTVYSMFPLFPGIIRVFHHVFGLSLNLAAVAASWTASLVAAAGLFVVGNHVYDRRTGILLPMIWGALPHAFLESMAYTESLFTAFSAWTLYCLLTRRWITAGVLCLVGGLCRPTASSLVGVVGLAALIAIIHRRDGIRPWVAAVLAPIGWFGYIGWVALRTGRLDGWFKAQADWGSEIDGGGYFLNTYWHILSHRQGLHFTFVALMLLLAFALFLIGLLDRQPWQLSVFSALILTSIFITSGFFHSKARFLLPAFPLLLPVARALAATTWPRAAVVLTTMICISGAYAGYLLFVWGSSF